MNITKNYKITKCRDSINLRECTRCKMLLPPGNFGNPRLNGREFRTCLKCLSKAKRSREKNKCPHNKQRYDCRKCLGKKFCEHNRIQSTCKECRGGSICKHNRVKSQCKDCHGGSICEHGRRRSRCKDCKLN